MTGLKNKALLKYPYFWSNQAVIQVLLSTNVWVILTEFYDNRAKIVDFLLMANVRPISKFYALPPRLAVVG